MEITWLAIAGVCIATLLASVLASTVITPWLAKRAHQLRGRDYHEGSPGNLGGHDHIYNTMRTDWGPGWRCGICGKRKPEA